MDQADCTVIAFPSGPGFLPAHLSRKASRPDGGTLDPRNVMPFLFLHPNADTFRIACRFGWSPEEAYGMCHTLRRKGIVTYGVRIVGRETVSLWRLTPAGREACADAMGAELAGAG